MNSVCLDVVSGHFMEKIDLLLGGLSFLSIPHADAQAVFQR